MLSSAFSIASYTAVLTETFAAIGMSTIMPPAIAACATIAKNSPELIDATLGGILGANPFSKDEANAGKTPDEKAAANKNASQLPNNPSAVIKNILKTFKEETTALPLLVPTSAHLEGEFEFKANESYKGHVDAGIQIQMITVKAGFSALYEESSSNKIKIGVDFGLVEYKL